MKKIKMIQCGMPGTDPEDLPKLVEQLKDEMGDAQISLSLLAIELDIDLGEVTIAKFNKTSDKVGFPHKLENKVSIFFTETEGNAKAAIINEVLEERDKQDNQWGGPDHDDTHTAFDWLGFIGGKVHSGMVKGMLMRTVFIKIAALALAAIESMDRKTIAVNKVA